MAKKHYLCCEMKRIALILAYWTTALFMLAVILCSAGYALPDALFIGTSLLPIAILFRYLLSRMKLDMHKSVWNISCLVLFILTCAFLIIHLGHIAILYIHHQIPTTELGIPPMLLNPVFLLAMLLLLIIGDYFYGHIIEQYMPEDNDTITFVCDRQPVTLMRQDILYVESCDTETWIYATEERRFRNKRSISAWSNLLGSNFMRIHRSYLVRTSACQGCEGNNVILGEIRLPISRKYRGEVQETLSTTRGKVLAEPSSGH